MTIRQRSNGCSTRRTLHQPLYPIQWTPPPPSLVFPQPPPPAVAAAAVTTTPDHSGGPGRTAAIAASASVAALALLSLSFFFLYRRRTRSPPDSRKFTSREVGSPSSPYLILDVHNRSPDLRPLPPLALPAPPPPRQVGASSDEETFYTALRSVESGYSGSPGSTISEKDPRARFPFAPPPPPPPPPPAKMVRITKTPLPPPLPTQLEIITKMPSPPSPLPRRKLLKPLPSGSTTVDFPSLARNQNGNYSSQPPPVKVQGEDLEMDQKPRLKQLHWDKVRASSDKTTVWDKLKSGSFKVNEDMIETLFVSNAASSSNKEMNRRAGLHPQFKQEERVLDPKKAQNIAILLRALNVTREEVSEALLDGNSECLGAELLETLAKMAPTKEEELKLKGYSGDISKLGSAERFLKAVLDVPFAFTRVDAMLYRANFETEVNYLRKCFKTLEAACEDLRSSRLFLKLLDAVLKTGNRMNVGTNRGEAKAFKLDTLLKLADVKGTDGKTTLLHFVVQEISSEGSGSNQTEQNPPNNAREEQFKRQGLKVVAGLSSELGNVIKAAGMDSHVLSGYVSKLEIELVKIKSVLQREKSCTQGTKFFATMNIFREEAEREIKQVRTEEKSAFEHVKDITEYYHGDAANVEAHPLRIFMVVRDFLSILDNVCKDVGKMQERTLVGSGRSFYISASASLPARRFEQHRETSSDEDTSSS